MSLRVGVVALAVSSLVLAGCVEGVDDALDDPLGDAAGKVRQFVNPLLLEHEHDSLAEHNITNYVTLVGHDGVGANGLPPGYIGEIDAQGDYAYLAMLGYGFAIVDISDPTQPKTVSTVEAVSPDPIKYAADIKVDKTGNWVFLAMELSSTPGLLIYDATNKANPKLAGAWIVPGSLLGCHMIEYAEIGGQEYLFCAPLDNAIYIGLLTPLTPAGVREVVPVARFTPASVDYVEKHVLDELGPGLPLHHFSGHHDMTFQLDPLTDKPTIYVSFWNLGVRFVDVSIPAAPLEIGAWDGEDAESYRGLIHTTMAYKSSDGRRIIVTIPEVAEPPAVFVLDATDLANPKLLAEWRALEDFKGQDQSFSTHNFQIVGEKVYLAMYHGGLWVLDLKDPAQPTPIGSYLPTWPRPDGAGYVAGPWDVVVSKGYMLTGDGDGGFYVLHHEGDPAGDPAYASFA